MKYRSIISGFLLFSYSLVLMHGIVHHEHDEVHQKAGIHHHHEGDESHDKWGHLLGHLLEDIIQIDLGQNHFTQFTKSASSEDLKRYKSADLNIAADLQNVKRLPRPSVHSPLNPLERANYPIFLLSHSRRGPPPTA